MTFVRILQSFVADKQFTTVIALVCADVVLGVAAAIKTGGFNAGASGFDLGKLYKFLVDDGLGKVVPWFVVFTFSKLTGSALLAGVGDWTKANDLVFGIVSAALLHSVATSFADLGVPLPVALTGWRPKMSMLAGATLSIEHTSSYPYIDGPTLDTLNLDRDDRDVPRTAPADTPR